MLQDQDQNTKRAIGALRDRAQRRPLILVIDDDSAILDSLNLAMLYFGIDLKLASDSITAVGTYRQHRALIQAALIDVQIPDCDGPAILDLLKAVNPSLQTCFMTSYGGKHSLESLQQVSGRPVLRKPFVSLEFVALTLWQLADADCE